MLDWKSAVQEVAGNNPTLAGLRASQAAARSEVRASMLQHLPTANFVYEKDQSEIIFPDAFLNTGPSHVYRHGWRGGLNLFSGFGILGTNRAAHSALLRTQEESRRASAQIRFELSDAFGRLLLVQERIKLLRDVARRMEADVELVEIRFKAGLAPRWTLLSARAQAAEARWRIQETELSLTVRRRKLLSVLGRTTATALQVSGDFESQIPPEVRDPRGRPLEEHPDVAFRSESLELARNQVTIAQSGFWPSVNLSAQYLWQDAVWPPHIKTWTLGLGVNLPVFSAPRNYFLLDAAKKRVRLEEQRLRGIRDLTEDSLEDSYARYYSSHNRLAITRSLLEAEVEREETLRASFKGGRSNYFEWNSAVTRRNELELSRLDDRFNAYLNRAAWVRSLGVGLEDEF